MFILAPYEPYIKHIPNFGTESFFSCLLMIKYTFGFTQDDRYS